MNRTHLAAFHAVADAGSFSRGAEAIMISQPAVSQHVGDLERALAVKLFDRLPRGVRLTDAGQLLLGYARRIAATEQEAEQAFKDLRGLKSGKLVLGASLTVGAYLLPRLLGAFRRQYPGIELELEIANTETVEQRLTDGLYDLGLTEGLGRHGPLIAEVFRQDELLAIAPPDHAELTGKPVKAKAFCAHGLILREKGSGTRDVVEAALRRKKISATPAMALGSTEAIKEAVAAGIGVAFVSRLALANERGRVRAVPLADLAIRRPLHLLRSPHREVSRASAEFQRLLTLDSAKGQPR